MSARDLMVELLEDMETLLATNENFLLGNWLKAAKSIPGASSDDQKLYQYNARNQITLWGPNGEIKGSNYSCHIQHMKSQDGASINQGAIVRGHF